MRQILTVCSQPTPDHGGNDTITTGDGNDIIIGGEDGELVSDAEINRRRDSHVVRTVVGDVNVNLVEGDIIDAGSGQQHCLSVTMVKLRRQRT